MKLLFSLLALCALSSCKNRKSESPPSEPMPVKVSSPFKETVELTRIFSGRFVPSERVEVRARVSGYIDQIAFTEGQEVREGALLMRIDPRLFEAEVSGAQAQLSQAQSSLKLAQDNFDRANKLVGSRAISQEEVDIRAAEVSQASASIQVAEARLQTARLNRSFSEIKAPISGIAGKHRITRGNFITGGNAAAQILTTIVPHSPIYCTFEVDERQVLEFTRLFFDGRTEGRGGTPPTVEIAVSDEEDFAFEGVVNYAENELDPSTATLQIRAKVPNKDRFLTPGLFARVRVKIGDPTEELLVQESALGFDQSKRFAWVLSEDQSLQRRYVEVGELFGKMRVIKAGLKEGEQIAVGRIQLIRPGMKISPIETPMKSE